MKVAIIMGSTSDLPKVEPAISILENYDIDTPLYNFFIKKYRTGFPDV